MAESDFKEKYQAAIPDCCELRTFEQHAEELLFCWGLANQVRENKEPIKCGMCEYNTDPEAEVLRKEYKEQQLKARVWETLAG